MPRDSLLSPFDPPPTRSAQESGVFDVFVQPKDAKTPTKVHSYRVAEGFHPCFGELALMYAKPRAATVKCAEGGVLWGLDRVAFSHVQTAALQRDLTRVLAKVEGLTLLPFDKLQALRDKMVDVSYKAGEEIVNAGADADRFFAMQSGSVLCTEPEKPEEEGVLLEEGAWFGEQARRACAAVA